MSFEEAKFFKEAEQDALDCAGTKKKKREGSVLCFQFSVCVYVCPLGKLKKEREGNDGG